MDSFDYAPRIDAYEQRIRQARIRDKLRILRTERPLLLDHYYLSGNLNEWQWNAGHLFREERMTLVEARSRGRARGAQPADARPRKATGYNMQTKAIERALAIERHLPPEWFEWTLGLIGEKMIRVEIPQAQNVTVALAEFYYIRPPRVTCGTREK